MIVQEPVQAAIWHCLNNYAYSDAEFLAERLCAEVQSEESVLLLCTCYYRAGAVGQAYSLLKSRPLRLPLARYLLALCCVQLERLAEAEAALCGGSPLKPRSASASDDISTEFGDAAAFVYKLLARIYSRTERKAKAADACRRALKANPFLFQSYMELCRLGERADSAKVFTTAGLDSFPACGVGGTAHAHNSSSAAQVSLCTPHLAATTTTAPVASSNAAAAAALSVSNQHNLHHPTSTTVITGNLTSTPILSTPVNTVPGGIGGLPALCLSLTRPTPPESTLELPRAKQALFRSLLASTSSAASTPFTPSFGCVSLETPGSTDHGLLPLGPLSSPALTNNVENSSDAKPRRTLLRKDRLFSLSGSAVKENNKSSRFVTPKSPSRKIKTRSSKTPLNSPSFTSSEMNEKNRVDKLKPLEPRDRPETITSCSVVELKPAACQQLAPSSGQQLQVTTLSLQRQSAEGLMVLLRELGLAYQNLCQFNGRRVVDILSALPTHQYQTGWVLSVIGKAYFELNNYTEAVRYFEMVRVKEPYRLQMMEYYGTALWHLQREVQLSALAQDLLDHGRDSAQAWCAAGNCFSLQKEHDTAIKFFNRAVQVSPQFAYAHTLLGHEYVLTEELDKAMTCFRRAVGIDPRHYNAWYGIGMIFYKQERYRMAEMYFKNALEINSQSSVLLCHIGVVQHNLQRSTEALRTLDRAMALDPSNPLCLFHRASINLSCGRLQEALQELQRLKQLVPKESLVFFLAGKVYEKMGKPHQARMHYSWAMDLDPKGANNQLKEAIEPAASTRTPSSHDKTGGSVGVLGSSLLSPDMVAGGSADITDQLHSLQAMDSDDSL